jgi:glutamine synthetase
MSSSNPRNKTIEAIAQNTEVPVRSPQPNSSPSDLFGQNVFSLTVMRQVLPRSVYEHMQEIRESGNSLDPAHADVIASAMKDWAMARGATHYCHWFHPLTGLTAEKHLAFLIPTGEGGVITEFAGADLLQGEPDASSFPSGGIRSTFEARGYTGWDPTGDAFLMDGAQGKTLCIPSVFIGYGGQALDKKTPLLRSMDALSRASLRVLGLFGNTTAKRVTPTVGCEQEYFLIDRRWFLQRPDLIATGRTLFGAKPSKGQEMEDHYFGTIKERALAFMEDVEQELYKLGIPVTTRHNEVAPSQYEFAPVFERSHVATDHNLLTMSVMMQVARHHGFECLLHEKPFAGVNGSGKHNNWSLADEHGHNLLNPGSTPQQNAQFLVFLTAVLRAVHVHADLLRASVATPNNDHRLGANEAPPAIISVFLGEKLTEIVKALISGSEAATRPQSYIDIGVASLPHLPRHDSDRNRTSPFAFTGSKFEFRAVGSAQNVARPNMMLNTIVAESLNAISDQIERQMTSGKSFNDAVKIVVQKELREHETIIFNGDNYAAAWHKEAESRGLPNLRSCVDAIPCLITRKAVHLFSSQGVLTEEELRSRYHIQLEQYIKTLSMEAAVISNLGRTMILPAALEYQHRAAVSLTSVRTAVATASHAEQTALLTGLTAAIERFSAALGKLDEIRHEIEPAGEDLAAKAQYCRERVLSAMEDARAGGDALELLIDDALWPLPKYREMLFVA